MKKLLALITVFVILAIAASTVLAEPKEKEPIDKITFIHYKDGTIKETGKGALGQGPSCYKLMGIKWNSLSINYVINPSTQNTKLVTDAIPAATSEWDSHTNAHLFGTYSIDPNAQWESGSSPDYKNSYVFGYISNTNIIAVTNVWYTRYDRQIVDYDVLFNTYYTWKDCEKTSCTSSTDMDLQDIATHETGHGLGLDDIYQSTCKYVTMFGYASAGEMIKRDLAQPDITGLQKLYGV
jgi:hypothetical protein